MNMKSLTTLLLLALAGAQIALAQVGGGKTGTRGGSSGPHASTHAAGGSDAVTLTTNQITGLNTMAESLAAPDWNSVANKPTTFTPASHAASHSAVGADAVALEIAQVNGLASALASAGAETPTWANHFVADITGVAGYNSGTATPDTANSRVIVGNGTGGTRGATLGNFTPSVGQSYLLVLYVDSNPTVGWEVYNKSTFTASYKLATIYTNGWYSWRFTTDGASKPIISAVSGAAASSVINLGYAALYTAPSPLLNAWASDGVMRASIASLTTNKLDILTSHVAVGAGINDYSSTAQASALVAPSGWVDGGGGSSEGMPTMFGPNSTTLGFGSGLAGLTYSGGSGKLAIGDRSVAASWRTTAIGSWAQALPVSSTVIGWNAFSGKAHATVIGRGATLPAHLTTAAGEGLVGIHGNEWYMDAGWTHMTPHPRDASSTAYATAMQGTGAPRFVNCTLHGVDAYDARAGSQLAVADTAARDAITLANRWFGMTVYVTADDKTYMLNSSLDMTLAKKVATVARSANVVTLTYAAAHGYSVGQAISPIGIMAATADPANSTFVIASVPDSLTITYAATGADYAQTASAGGFTIGTTLMDNTKWVDWSTTMAKTTTQRMRSGSTVSLKFASACFYEIGQTITVANVGTGYDGRVVITDISTGNQIISYTATGAGSDEAWTSDTDGTVFPNDLRFLNVAGGNLQLASGRGTGTGVSGEVRIQTAPVQNTGANNKNALVTAAYFDGLIDGANNKSRFLLYDTATGTYRRVEFGAADSAGTGYRVLRTAN